MKNINFEMTEKEYMKLKRSKLEYDLTRSRRTTWAEFFMVILRSSRWGKNDK